MSSTLNEFVSTPSMPVTAPSSAESAAAGRRLASGVLDSLLLLVALGLILSTELAIATDEMAGWVAFGWTVLFSPLYFALYHAYGTGATPGQLELRIGFRDTSTGERPGLARAVGRAYLSFAFLVLVLPAVVDFLFLAGGCSLRDRITRTTAVGIALEGMAPELAGPTTPELVAIFEPPAGTHHYLRRGWTLLAARLRLVLGAVAAVYAVLVAVAGILAFLVVADWPDGWTFAFYVTLVVPLFVSGIYWTQAAVVVAVEEVRVGRSDASVWATLVRASRRANALTAALLLLLLLLPLAYLSMWFVLPLLVIGRLTLVAPALVLEDTRVLGAFRRSWQLTRGKTWRLFGLLLLSAVMLVVVFSLTLGVASAVISLEQVDLVGLVGLVTVALLIVAPAILLLAWLGAAWSLVYEDARRALPPGNGR